MNAAVAIPVLETERLTLRGNQMSDFEGFAAFWASDRAAYTGGTKSRNDAWDEFTALAGQWLLRGYGFWIVESNSEKQFAGWVGFHHPERMREPELGWIMLEHYEGQGLAAEAAIAARNYGVRSFGINTPVSFITADNTRSIRLAERLGAQREDTRDFGNGPFHVYRHPNPRVLT